jgi:Protein of unknown function (DUF2442)/Domain of unknown function (DUF4160)
MYYNEYGVPHFNALYAGEDALLAIETLEILGGSLPDRAVRLVRELRRSIGRNSRRTGSGLGPVCRSSGSRLWRRMELMNLVHVTAVEIVGEHGLRLSFEDGAGGEVDLSTWAWPGGFEPLRDPQFFAQVRLDDELGTIVWPNGADIAPESLHAWVMRGLNPPPA